MMFLRKILNRRSLTFVLVSYVSLIMLASILISAGISLFFFFHSSESRQVVSINLALPIGIALAYFFSQRVLRPIRNIIEAITKVAQGDFDTRLETKGVAELRELEISFNKMTQELSSIETMRSDFINQFAHQFKTPIVSIRGFAKLLRKGNLSEAEKDDFLQIIVTESERLDQLSTNILNLTKYENIHITSHQTTFRLDEQIRKVILLMEQRWVDKNISLDVQLDEVLFTGNEGFTHEIWINLLDNAIKYSYSRGLLSVRLENTSRGIRFVLQDNGTGMDESTKTHLFDKFYRGNNSEGIGGNGLGLAIVKRIVDLCNGTIDVQSELGRGSTFTIILPDRHHTVTKPNG